VQILYWLSIRAKGSRLRWGGAIRVQPESPMRRVSEDELDGDVENDIQPFAPALFAGYNTRLTLS
jgi:hypothetical protein